MYAENRGYASTIPPAGENTPFSIQRAKNRLDESIDGKTGKYHTRVAELFQIGVVELEPVPVTLADGLLAVKIVCERSRLQAALLGTEPHGAAKIGVIVTFLQAAVAVLPLGDQRDHRMRIARVELGAVGSLNEVLLGPSRVSDGTMNLVGALRRAMAICGYSDLKEFQRVEVILDA